MDGQIIGVVGWKDSGKTAVVERLVGFLTRKGFAVGTLKHVHRDLSLQPEAKDSMKHLGAGAKCTVALADDLAAVMCQEHIDVDQAIARYLWFCDYLVVEGFRHLDIPKIAVVSDHGDLPQEIGNVVAVVYRKQAPGGFPAFTLGEITNLGDFLFEREVLKEVPKRASLLVNGKPVPMNEFVQSSLSGVLKGFIASLRDVDEPSTIELAIKMRQGAQR